MLKRFSFWLWTAVVLQFLTGLIHSLSLFMKPNAQNDTERQLIDLMSNYRLDMGAGYHRSMVQILTALSSCYSLLCFLGALTLAYLLKKNAPLNILKGVAGINLLIFGIAFAMMVAFTFLPPIILTGLIVATLGAGFLLLRTRSAESI